MAKVIQNILTAGLSGKIGNQIVFRQVGGRTLACAVPRKRTVISAAQQSQQLRFKQAVSYAKGRLLDPIEKSFYKTMAKKGNLSSAFAAAVADFLKRPEIRKVNTQGYRGFIEDVILITVNDNLKVISVRVDIAKADDSPIENGVALLGDGVHWKYYATSVNTALSDTKVTVVATDRAGNETTFRLVLP